VRGKHSHEPAPIVIRTPSRIQTRAQCKTSVFSITMTLSDWNEYDTNNDNEALRTRMNAMILRKEILHDLIEVDQITSELYGEHCQRRANPDYDLRRRCQEIPWVSFTKKSLFLVFHCVAGSHPQLQQMIGKSFKHC
jgi:hypothetical protein